MIVIADFRSIPGTEHKRLIALSYGAIIESIISLTVLSSYIIKEVEYISLSLLLLVRSTFS